jgi:hypothetical protein
MVTMVETRMQTRPSSWVRNHIPPKVIALLTAVAKNHAIACPNVFFIFFSPQNSLDLAKQEASALYSNILDPIRALIALPPWLETTADAL